MVNNHQAALASARAFLDDKKFDTIVQICALKSRNDWRVWYDENNNYLRLHKNGSIHIYPSNEIEIDTNDIYRKSKPDQIANVSCWALLGFGREDSVIWFIGNDRRLRVSCFQNEHWIRNQLPLLSGVPILKLIAERMTILPKQQVELDSFEFAYTTGWPPEEKNIDKRSASIFKKCGIDGR